MTEFNLAPQTITVEGVMIKAVASEVRIEKLEEYQDKQNGHLALIRDTVADLDHKLDVLKNWIMGLMGSMVIGLIILIVRSFVK